jgi:superfamily II DNA or RNA helicase
MTFASSSDQIPPPALRDYQERATSDIWQSYASGRRAPLLQLATGAGKTIIFAEITRRAWHKNNRVLIVAHRHELVEQAAAKLMAVGIMPGIIAAGTRPNRDAPVQVASIQTAIRRDPVAGTKLMIVDEAHHSAAPSYRTLAAMLPDARLLGCTATPSRLDGKGLGVHAHGLFDDLITGATVKELTDAGWLCPAKVYVAKTRLDLRHVRTVAGDYHQGQLAAAVMAADLAGDAVKEYRRLADHQPATVFCVTVAHAEATALAFHAAGYRTGCVHGALPRGERDRLIRGLGSGEIEVLTSCEILGEGVDVPVIGAAILLRPTQSLTVYLQQVGRGLRPAPGKSHLTVLDIAGNALVHGLPDEVHRWSLDAAPKRPAPDLVVNEDGLAERAPIVTDTETELVELSQDRLARICRLPYREFLAVPRARFEIEAYRRAHGYKRGWVWHVQHHQGRAFGAAP